MKSILILLVAGLSITNSFLFIRCRAFKQRLEEYRKVFESNIIESLAKRCEALERDSTYSGIEENILETADTIIKPFLKESGEDGR